MSKYNTYELKIEPKYYKDVYRIIMIDGNETLDDLASAILSAFDFDNDHLYMFSMTRNRYDSEGYFHPEASGKNNAAEVILDELNLKIRNKFMFLYDFGDEWMFDVTVKKIMQNEILSLTFVKEQSGGIEQYPDYDAEEWEEEYEEFYKENDSDNKILILDSNNSMIDLLAKNKTSDLKSIMTKLGIKSQKVSKGASKAYASEIVKYLSNNKEKLLGLLTPSAAYLLLCIASKDNDVIMLEIMKTLSIDILINLGLLEVGDKYEGNSIELTKEFYTFANFLSEQKRMNSIKQSHEWQKTIIALVNLYGVADLEFLHQTICKHSKGNIDFDNFEKTVIEPLAFWDEMNVFENDSIQIASLFDETQTEFILMDRNNFDIYNYKTFEDEELSAVISEGIVGLVPSTNDLLEYLIVEKGLSTDTAGLFMAELSLSCLIAEDKDFILETCEEKLDDYSLKLTKKLKNIILKFIQQHPCSILMGYSWDEYNNRNKTANNQMNLFDDLPF